MNLKRKTIGGLFWRGSSEILTHTLQTIVNIILARLLLPADFGVIGMATIFTNFVAILNRMGMGSAIIYHRRADQETLSTAFWISQLEGLLLFLISLATAPWIANFFGQPALKTIIPILSIGFILSSLNQIHLALIDKKLLFKKSLVPEVGNALIYGLVAISMALRGYGVMSIAIGSISSTFAGTFLYWLVMRWRPILVFKLKKFKNIFHYGLRITAQQFLNYFATNADYFLIGKFLGAADLGIYTLAYNLATLPQRKIIFFLEKVMFPVYAKIQSESERLARGYQQGIKYILAITYPITAGLMVVAPEFIEVIYTQKWSLAIIPVQLLAIRGLFGLNISLSNSVFLAKGRAGLAAKYGLVRLIMIASAVGIGLKFGIVGVSLAVTIAYILLTSAMLLQTLSLIKVSIRRFLKILSPILSATIIMMIGVYSLRLIDRNFLHLSQVQFLISAILAGAFIYIVLLYKLDHKLFSEIFSLVPWLEIKIKIKKLIRRKK